MKALHFLQHGELEVVKYGDVPDPVLKPGQVLVKVRACAINHLDIWVRRGWPGLRLPMPHWCGADVAGEVIQPGEGVAGWTPGQKVVDVLPPENRQGNPSLANYTSLIREVDSQIGRFLAWLRERGLADDTIVIVTGDHGEAFGEPHGGSGHGFTAYDEELRVPLIIWNPRLFRDGGRVTTVGSHIDLAPTILDLLGLRSPNGWDGASLFDERKPPRAYLFAAAWGQYLLGVRSGDWKYIYDARLGSEELYNLTEDPDERRDLSRLEPVRA